MVYIQIGNKQIGMMPQNFDAACAMYGALENDQQCRFVTIEEVEEGKLDLVIKRNLFVGSSEFMQTVFSRVGKNPCVPANSNREHKIMTAGEVRDMVNSGKHIFVKPLKVKQFTGMVMDVSSLNIIRDVDDSEELMTYEPFDSRIVTEWRLYVHMNSIVDARHYSGDFWVIPDLKRIGNTIIKGFCKGSKFPMAYTADIALMENGEHYVIEFNDMWAIGNYGIPNDIYYRLLSDRYFEIMRG